MYYNSILFGLLGAVALVDSAALPTLAGKPITARDCAPTVESGTPIDLQAFTCNQDSLCVVSVNTNFMVLGRNCPYSTTLGVVANSAGEIVFTPRLECCSVGDANCAPVVDSLGHCAGDVSIAYS